MIRAMIETIALLSLVEALMLAGLWHYMRKPVKQD